MPRFIALLDAPYSLADWDSLCDHLRDVQWEDIFKVACVVNIELFCMD